MAVGFPLPSVVRSTFYRPNIHPSIQRSFQHLPSRLLFRFACRFLRPRPRPLGIRVANGGKSSIWRFSPRSPLTDDDGTRARGDVLAASEPEGSRASRCRRRRSPCGLWARSMRDFSGRGKSFPFFASSQAVHLGANPPCRARLRPTRAVRWVVGNSLARRVSVKTSPSARKISYCESSERRQSATSARILERGFRRRRNIIPKGRMILQPLPPLFV